MLPAHQPNIVPHASCPPIKGCDPCFPAILPTHQSKVVTHASCPPLNVHLLLTDWLCPMPAARQLVTPNACYPPTKRCAPCLLLIIPCLLPTKQWSPAAYQLVTPNACCHLPKGYAQCPNQKVVPKSLLSCPLTKRLCPTPAAHQPKHAQCLLPIKQKVGPHCLILLSVPLNHKVVPNAPCCTNCVVSKACCTTITRFCPLHAAQIHIHCMLLRAVSNTCCSTINCLWLHHHMALPNAYSMRNTCCSPTISLYPMLAAPTIARPPMHTTPHR